MCLIVFGWRAHARYPLVVAANRDEWRARPSAPLHRWDEPAGIVAGRDLQAGGTWLGLRGPRFAALTNVREPSLPHPGARSRGGLVVDYLQREEAPAAHLAALAAHAAHYPGFNLLAGDADSLGYFGSLRGEVIDVAPGVHGLSNHRLDEPWPKVLRAKAALGRALAASTPAVDELFELLSDARGVRDAELPDTGVGLELERKLAPVLLVGPNYGTRCSTVLLRRDDGHLTVHERTRDEHGRVVSEVVIASPEAA